MDIFTKKLFGSWKIFWLIVYHVTPYRLGRNAEKPTSVGLTVKVRSLAAPASVICIRMHPKVIPKRKLHSALQKHIQKL